MRYFVPLIVAWVIFGCVGPAAAEGIVIVQTSQAKPVREAVTGFKSTLEAGIAHRGPKMVQPLAFHQLTVSTKAEKASIIRQIKNWEPDLVLAVGSTALAQLEDLRDVPILFMLAGNPAPWVAEHSNVTGIAMALPPPRWFELIRTKFPGRTRIGLLYKAEGMTPYVRAAEAAAPDFGLSLIARRVTTPKNFYDNLQGLAGLVDILWMLPDPELVSAETVDLQLLFSLHNSVPVITFAEMYLVRGATIGLVLDFKAMGEQAGEMAGRLLNGTPTTEIPPEIPSTVHIRVNPTVAKRFGVAPPMPPGFQDERAR